MIFSTYASARHFDSMLRSLTGMLEKAQAHAAGMISDPDRLAGFLSQLDASAMARQVLSACDTAEEAVTKLCRVPSAVHGVEGRGLDELKLRIERAADFVRSVDPDRLENAGDELVTLTQCGREVTLNGADYLLDYVIPSFHLHVASVFHVLRQHGVDLDDRDYGPGTRSAR